MAFLLAIIAWAFAQWGAAPVPVRTFIEPIQLTASFANIYSDPQEIHVDSAWLARARDGEVRSVMLHEVGHVLGLGHYGDCNTMGRMAIMGCGALEFITEYDRARLAVVGGYQVRLAMVVR